MNYIRLKKHWMFFFLSAVLISCSTTQPSLIIDQIVPPSTVSEIQTYRIQSGDELDIKFFFNPELNERVIVRPDGKISLQLVEEVKVTGLTPSQLDDYLTKQYAQDLKKPEVAVIVRSFSGQRIYIGGEVNRQELITLPHGMTALQAVFKAGGFKETAEPKETIVIRKGEDNQPIPIRIDLAAASYGKGNGARFLLQPDDIVYVPKSAIAEANKFVNQYIEKLFLFRGISLGFSYDSVKF